MREIKLQWKKLKQLDLNGFENQYPNQLIWRNATKSRFGKSLSYGYSDIMLMDEAFSALDPLIRSDMQKQLMDLTIRVKKNNRIYYS